MATVREARITLHVAGVHCPSCVDTIDRHLQQLGKSSGCSASIKDVSVSILDHTVAFTLRAAQLTPQQNNADDVESLKGPLRQVVAVLTEEGYAPDAIEIRILREGLTERHGDNATATRILSLDAIDSPQGTDCESPERARGSLSTQYAGLSLWQYLTRPLAATREAKRQRLLQARWRRHLQACTACQNALASGNAVAVDQMHASGSRASSENKFGSAEEFESHAPTRIQLTIGGMTCSACVGAVEGAASAVDGVVSCSVNLMSNSATVTIRNNNARASVVEAIEDAGYEVEILHEEQLDSKLHASDRVHSYKIELSIDGMTCAACVSNAQRSVESAELPPSLALTSFTIKLLQSSATAIIAVQDRATIEDVRQHTATLTQAIEDAGYDATVVKIEPVSSTQKTAQPTFKDRVARIAVDGMFCGECVKKVRAYLRNELSQDNIRMPSDDIDAISLAKPLFVVTFPQQSPIKLRDLLASLDSLDPAFTARLVKPASPAQRSAQRARQELITLIIRLLVAFLFLPPTLLIAVVAPTFLSTTHPLRQSLAEPLAGETTKGDFILLALATPVQFLVGSLFHMRAIKSLRAVWRRKGAWKDRLIRWGDMNVLVSLGTSVAYFASLAFLIVDATMQMPEGPMTAQTSTMLYFDACVFLIFFILLGRVLEAASKRSTMSTIDALGSLRPSQGILIDQTADHSREIDIELLEVDDLVMIPNGSSPPLDAVFVSYVGSSRQDHGKEGEKTIKIAIDESKGKATLNTPTASFSEAAISGESRPVTKAQGDTIYAGTINESSKAVVARVTARAGDCVIDSIVDAVRSAGNSGQKAAVERLADRVTAHFVPAIVVIAIAVFVIWVAVLFSGAVSDDWISEHVRQATPTIGSSTGPKILYALQFAVSCLVIACPCGIGLAAPAAHAVAIGLASRHGILAQGGGQAFEVAVRFALASRPDLWQRACSFFGREHSSPRKQRHGTAYVFDKTGTLTTGSGGRIVDHHFGGCHGGQASTSSTAVTVVDRNSILEAVRAIESTTTHPMGTAVAEWCVKQSCTEKPRDVTVAEVEEMQGRGLRARALVRDGGQATEVRIHIGSGRLFEEVGATSDESANDKDRAEQWQRSGASVVHIAVSDSGNSPRFFAMLAIADPVREEAPSVTRYLTSKYSSCWIVSGDAEHTTRAIGEKVAIPPNNVISGVLPAEKADWVNRIRHISSAEQTGADPEQASTDNIRLVAFVGDGINDAPALAAADLSIALGSGSTLAQSSAMFVLMGSDTSATGSATRSSSASHRPLAALPVLLSLSRATHAKVWQNLVWACLFNAVCLPIAAGVLVPAGFTLGPSWSGLAMALSSTAVVLNALTLRLWRSPKLL